MKKFLAVLTLTFLLSLAVQADDFYTGAYWTLKAPLAVSRESGQCNVLFGNDKSVIFQTYFNGGSSLSATGTWAAVKGKFSFVGSNAKFGEPQPSTLFTVKGSALSGFASGTFTVYFDGQFYKGKWQATFP